MSTDNDSELREALSKLQVPKMVVWVDDKIKVETDNLTEKTINEIMALLATHVKQAEARARIDSLADAQTLYRSARTKGQQRVLVPETIDLWIQTLKATLTKKEEA